MLLRRLRRISLIINVKSLFITSLALISTYLCLRYNIHADLPLTILTTAVVFPVVFSIGGAYKRREVALDQYSLIKAHGRALCFATRDWLDVENEESKEVIKILLKNLLCSCRTMFSEPIEKMPENEKEVYKQFSLLSKFINQDLRQLGLPSGEASRANQYLSKAIGAFEKIKHIYQYRTPRTLRAFSDLFITILPPLYGPYFASLFVDGSSGFEYIVPILFSVILVSLDNIQEHLENPFDQVGEDDVTINAEKFVELLDV